ncbi:MAG: hypothetical protein JO257_20435 [Deltaproteobacteria bacterium]|nr:hypothetical protein [Deltaproteobacteria bacterium]
MRAGAMLLGQIGAACGRLALVLCVAACGRLGFDAHTPDGAAPGVDAAAFDPASGGCQQAESGPLVLAATAPTHGGGYGVWAAPPYVLQADTTGGLHNLRFDGTAFTEVGALPGIGWTEAVWSDRTHYYVGAPGTGFYVIDVAADGSLAIRAQQTTTLSEARHGWLAGGMIVVPDGPNGLYAVQYDGVGTLTTVGTPLPTMGWAQGVWARDRRVVFADANVVRMLDFDGATFTDLVTPNAAHGGASRVWSDGSIVYVTNGDGVTAYAMTATTLTELDTFAPGAAARDVWSDGAHVFTVAENGMLYALAFDGAHFTMLDSTSTGTQGLGVFGDGTFVYSNDNSGGVHAYRGFSCLRW